MHANVYVYNLHLTKSTNAAKHESPCSYWSSNADPVIN